MRMTGVRVLMMVINPMTADARVAKEAATLGQEGGEVTVLATAAPGLRSEEDRDGYRVLRLPYRRVVKDRIVERRVTSRREVAELRHALRIVIRKAPWTGHRYLSIAVAWLHLRRLALRQAIERLRWAAGGMFLKLVRSRILPAEYWGGTVRRVPDLLPRCDVLHAHDLGTLAAAVRLADTWSRQHPKLPRPRVVYDSHELYVEQTTKWTRLEKILWKLHERRWIRRADLVITVSEGIARELQKRYRLTTPPLVVYNSPPRTEQTHAHVRFDAGLPEERALAVYVGAVKPGRGVDRLVPALQLLEDWDLAIVGAGTNDHVGDLLARAEHARVASRIHVLPAVAAPTLPAYLRSATLGIHPMERVCRNHELALPNKLFDYVFAGLPVAVSDLEEMSRFVAAHGVGVTFDPEQPESIAAAITTLVDGRHRFVPSDRTLDAIEATFGWSTQAAKLLEAYAGLLGERARGLVEGARAVAGSGVMDG